jgi:hypothetical protein
VRLSLPILAVLALVAIGQGEGPPPPAPVIEVAGLAVVRENIDAAEAEPYKPFGLERGTTLSLIFRLPEQRIVSFDQGESSVGSLVDDKGTNLMAISHRLQVPGFLGHGCGVLKNGQMAHVEIFGGTPPVAGTTMVQARGHAVFFTGSQVAKVTTDPIKAEKDAEVRAGEHFGFQLSRWEAGGIGGNGANLTLRLEFHPAIIAGLRFSDGEGNPVESRPAGVAVERAGDKRVFLLHHQLAAMPRSLSLEIEYWSDLQRVEVPFDVKAGVGGGL